MFNLSNNKRKKLVEEAVIKEIRDKDFSLNTVNNYGENLLHVCASNNCVDLVNEILSKKENKGIDRKNKFGWSPLMQAIRNGNVEVVKLLMQQNSSTEESNYLGMSTLSLAAAANKEIFDLVCKKNPSLLLALENDDIPPLCIAAMKNDKELFFRLLELGADASKDNAYTQLMMKRSSIPEIAALSASYMEEEDYWSEYYNGVQYKDADSESGTLPKIVLNQLSTSDEQQMINYAELFLVNNQANYQLSDLISPTLTYNKDGDFTTTPEVCYSRNASSPQVMKRKVDENSYDYKVLSPLKPGLGCKYRAQRPADLKLINSSEQVKVTLSFEAEYTPPKSPYVPVDIQDENSAFGKNTPTPPHCKTPPKGTILNAQQNKLFALLKRYKLNHHMTIFLEQEVDCDLFLTLNDQDLTEIGFQQQEDRKDLLLVIEENQLHVSI